MFKRIAAIGFIFFCTSIAWFVLGGTVFSRTYSMGPGLRDKVLSNWGGPQTQAAPRAFYWVERPETTEVESNGKKERRTAIRRVRAPLELERTRAAADVQLEYRQKGLLWYSTYGVAYRGEYSFRNPSANPETVTFSFPLPSQKAIYDDVVVTVDGKRVATEIAERSFEATAAVAPNAPAVFAVAYRSRGLDTWAYRFADHVAQVRDYELRVTTDFERVDFPEDSLSPSTKSRRGNGWELVWSYKNLMTGQQVRVAMPEKLQPGPVAGQLSMFAPVSLLFFFFVLYIVTTLRRIDLHPMNYFFLAAAFFAFHLLFAYTVDHVELFTAFLLSSVVSVFLVTTYLRLVVGTRFALVEAAAAQILYLVLFSYAFFFEGFTGLAITIGAIVTLFVAMQVTARVRWAIHS